MFENQLVLENIVEKVVQGKDEFILNYDYIRFGLYI